MHQLAASRTAGTAPLAFPDLSASTSFAGRLTAMLFILTVAIMFTLSGGVLWEMGVNYSGITGAMATKIHPATYLAFVTLCFLIVAHGNPASFAVKMLTRHPGALVFLMATVLLAAYIVLDERRGIATIFDNYLLAITLAVIAAELDARTLERVEKLIHVLLAANALMALVEYLANYRVFPYRFEGLAFDWDNRSTALLGHPLENAHITGTYLMILLVGGGSSMPRLLRVPAMLLQLAALVPFGGRTALLLAIFVMVIWTIPRVLGALRGGALSLPILATIAFLAPVLAIAAGLLANQGFFDVVLDRFTDDGGSAQTRVAMFEIFDQLSLRDIFVGANPDLIDAMRRSRGLEWGIENPVVRLVLYQGLAFTVFLIAGFACFLVEIGRRLRAGAAIPFIYFLVVANSYESISNKTIMLAQFVVLMLVMFDPRRAGNARTMALSTSNGRTP